MMFHKHIMLPVIIVIEQRYRKCDNNRIRFYVTANQVETIICTSISTRIVIISDEEKKSDEERKQIK